MVKLIMGLDGSGKTKTLIDLVRAAIDQERGDVVCITAKGKPIKPKTLGQKKYIQDGFLSGLHAGNYDITHFFIDDLNKILDDRSEEALERFLNSIERFGERDNVNFTITINADPASAGEGLRKYF